MTLRRMITAAATAAFCTVPAHGQPVSPRDMPTATALEAALSGADPVETSARHVGAFGQLQDVVKLVSGPPPARAANPHAVDPSITKARAAKVDTKVFGIPLGEPLDLPTCDPIMGLAEVGGACVFQMPFQGLGEALLGSLMPKEDLNEIIVMLPKASCPVWAAACQFTGTLYESLLVAAAIPTVGRGAEKSILRELRAKYGLPSGFYGHTITPNAGEPYKVQHAEWSRPGLHVYYAVVGTGGEGVLATDQGLVRIETESAYQRRMAVEEELAKPKL